ncbi:MAG: hypothetical protein A4E38_01332 [Methanoregulaceae archaeon PtaB.Bin108]|nr:MAG: hypothetical protein A4E38_01332 [Methanoregulaceae archaeon PtaB.Bin108]OPY45561.1 MAG: hypothetical protein A4E42_00754 [Methanoregulaceae archaeon PtaU1.Bin222]
MFTTLLLHENSKTTTMTILTTLNTPFVYYFSCKNVHNNFCVLNNYNNYTQYDQSFSIPEGIFNIIPFHQQSEEQ